MKDIEKFLIWFVPLFFLEYIFQGTASVFIAEAFSGYLNDNTDNLFSDSLLYFFMAIKPFLSFATKLLVSVWLYHQAKAYTIKPFHWAFFGVVSGVVAIAIFYLVRIYDFNQPSLNEKIQSKN